MNRDITIFEQAQARADDTWLVVFLFLGGCIVLGSAILEAWKMHQRSVIDSEVASLLRAKETIEKHKEALKEAEAAQPAAAGVTLSEAADAHLGAGATESRLPTLEEAAEELVRQRADAVPGGYVRLDDGELVRVPTEEEMVPPGCMMLDDGRVVPRGD